MGKARYVASRVCERCGCFRSTHVRGKVCGCGNCDAFVFTESAKPKRRRRDFTEEEIGRGKQMLTDGASYREVAATLRRDVNTIRQKFPGYNTNTDRDAIRRRVREGWNAADAANRAHVEWTKARRAADGRHGPPGVCAFDGCERISYAQNLCQTHYLQWLRRDGLLTPIGTRLPRKQRRCTFDGCERKHYARGLCHNHYNQMRRNGVLTPIRTPIDDTT